MKNYKSVELQKDFYKSELLKMGYFKTPEGLQLYELSISQLEKLYTQIKQGSVAK